MASCFEETLFIICLIMNELTIIADNGAVKAKVKRCIEYKGSYVYFLGRAMSFGESSYRLMNLIAFQCDAFLQEGTFFVHRNYYERMWIEEEDGRIFDIYQLDNDDYIDLCSVLVEELGEKDRTINDLQDRIIHCNPE